MMHPSEETLLVNKSSPMANNFTPSFGRSTSRMTLFHHCNKKYYFQYYTNYLKAVDTQIRLDSLLLKNLTSYKMRLGEKTHHILADYLRLLAVKHGDVLPEDIQQLKTQMADSITQGFTAAKERDYTQYNKDQKFGFKEFCYNEELPDDALEQAIQRVGANLDAFIASDMQTKVLQYFQNANKYYIESNESDFEQMKLVLDHDPI
jgi:hypothetical protein